MTIHEFQGNHRWLSNFVGGVEAKYQASKCANEEDKKRFDELTPVQAKRLGRVVKVRSDWEYVKIPIMYDLLKEKFSKQPFKRLLIDTGDETLVEGNYWGDRFWGVCGGQGENHLGKLLMRIRDEVSV